MKEGNNMNEKEHLEWLEEREKKLEYLESMIYKMQSQINDSEKITDKDDIKMEIFKLWYFNRFNKNYGE